MGIKTVCSRLLKMSNTAWMTGVSSSMIGCKMPIAVTSRPPRKSATCAMTGASAWNRLTSGGMMALTMFWIIGVTA